MKYFIDFEFHEGNISQQIKGIDIPKWLSKPLPNIQMISVGIVSEEYFVPKEQNDGKNTNGLLFESIIPKQKEYYAISKDFNLKSAWKNEWVRENVLKSIYLNLITDKAWSITFNNSNEKVTHLPFTYKVLKQLINKYGKTNKQIAQEIIEFIGYDNSPKFELAEDNIERTISGSYDVIIQDKPEFYAYYADYDWVVFCQLFGTMMDLPSGFPMFAFDLKQTLDEKIEYLYNKWKPIQNNKEEYLEHIKKITDYPKQTNEHNALADAKWNYELYNFLNTL